MKICPKGKANITQLNFSREIYSKGIFPHQRMAIRCRKYCTKEK